MDLITLISTIVLVGLLIGVIFFYQTRTPITLIEQLRPRDRRFNIMTVNNETDLSLHCKQKGGAFWRFIKLGTAWGGNIKGRAVTKFFGIEAYIWTTIFKDAKKVKVTISEFLRDCWGDDFYNTIPRPQRIKLEDGRIGLTVEPVEKFIGFDENISAEQINDEDEKIVLGGLAGGIKKATKQDIYKAALPFILGAMVMYFLIKQGYLP